MRLTCNCRGCGRRAKAYENPTNARLWWCTDCKLEIYERNHSDRGPDSRGHPGISLMPGPRSEPGSGSFDLAVHVCEERV